MSDHLDHGKHQPVTNPLGSARNGKRKKTLKGEFGELPIEIPRDRQGSFGPQLIPKHQTRWTGFDDKILSRYARGTTVREIQNHLEEMYRTEVLPTLISSVTDAVIEEVKVWQTRPLDAVYPIVYLDCIYVKVRDSGAVRAKAVYLAIGIDISGHKEVLGLWIAQSGGAKFWLQGVTELENRGLQDILLPASTGSRAFLRRLKRSAFMPRCQATVPHALLHSLINDVSWKTRKTVGTDPQACIYSLVTLEQPEQPWMSSSSHGVRTIRPSEKSGGGIGSESFRSLITRPKSAKSST